MKIYAKTPHCWDLDGCTGGARYSGEACDRELEEREGVRPWVSKFFTGSSPTYFKNSQKNKKQKKKFLDFHAQNNFEETEKKTHATFQVISIFGLYSNHRITLDCIQIFGLFSCFTIISVFIQSWNLWNILIKIKHSKPHQAVRQGRYQQRRRRKVSKVSANSC